MAEKKRDQYAESGVNIDAGNQFVKLIRPIVSNTFKSGVITDIGGFAGICSLPRDLKNPLLVASTDGVGTKLKVAFMMDKHDTVGIDLVAMSVNDILVQGATPLFMLDYLAMGRLDVQKAVQIVKGIAEGCKDAECSLIGGETAEMPGFYAEGEYDLAGFVVGVVAREQVLEGSEIAVGDQLVGLASSGLHSNGYSLVRKIFFEQLKMSVHDRVEEFGRTLGEELLEPTRIYVRTIKNLVRDLRVSGMAHITGGGITDNLPRILPKQCKAVVQLSSWTRPAIFPFLQERAKLSRWEMMRTFNNGLGLIMVLHQDHASDALSRLKAMGEKAFHIGSIEAKSEGEEPIQFV